MPRRTCRLRTGCGCDGDVRVARKQSDQFLPREAGCAGHDDTHEPFVGPLVPFRFVDYLHIHRHVLYRRQGKLCAQRNTYTCIFLNMSIKNALFPLIFVYTDSLKRINMKSQRQSAILDVVEQEEIRSQEQLRQRLSSRGFDVTQATLSRDIKELGLLKRSSDGAYQPAGAEARTSPASALDALGRALSEYLLNIEPVQQLIVLKTGAGQAQLLGLAIDKTRLPEVAGTIAGDDTILIIARNPKSAQAVAKQLRDLAN